MAERDLHLDDARCADLVLGLLETPERERAVEHAAACAGCAERLRSHVAAATRMRADEPGTRVARVVRQPRRSARVPWLAAAAALVLLIAWPRRADHLAPAVTGWLAMPSEGVLLREGASEDPHLAAGFAAYARHDLTTARHELEVARATETSEQARRLYLAHVLLLQGDARRAVALLRSLAWVELPAAVHRDAARLFVQALRATDQQAAADSLDGALRSTPEWVPVRP